MKANYLSHGSGRGLPADALAGAMARRTRIAFWVGGTLLAIAQAWVFRYQLSADSISYLDMSDGVQPGSDWHRLINGVWSPLYPFLVGLTRRIFHFSASNEIATAHFLNIGFFLFAFVCFEFFLRSLIRVLPPPKAESAKSGSRPGFPWALLSIAYSLFLWGTAPSIRTLRPDMLMSGFLYSAVAILFRMSSRPARWRDFLALGAVLGVGVLAKEPMLPIGVLILAIALLVVESRRHALRMAAAALALTVLIGALYFVPLSRSRGYFTLGESGAFNYIVHVDRAGPTWYLQDPGAARGSFTHPPKPIFTSPPAYAFAALSTVTHPLRFDPSYWIAGVRPHFSLRKQVVALIRNIRFISGILWQLGAVAVVSLALAYFSPDTVSITASLKRTWPVWLVGLAGCAMYALVHVESRYVAPFLVLFWVGIIFGISIPQNLSRRVTLVIVLIVVASLLLPVTYQTYLSRLLGSGRFNADAEAASELEKLGIRPGDRVARISPVLYDFGPERIARAEVIAEVEVVHATEFWNAPVATQQALLHLFAENGARVVIATSPMLSPANESGWRRLGSTQYWVWPAMPGN